MSSIALDFAVHLGGMEMYNDLRRQYCWSEMKRHDWGLCTEMSHVSAGQG